MTEFKKEGFYWVEMKTASGKIETIFNYRKERAYEAHEKTPLFFLGKSVNDFFQFYRIKAS
jgi:hypothetical protein